MDLELRSPEIWVSSIYIHKSHYINNRELYLICINIQCIRIIVQKKTKECLIERILRKRVKLISPEINGFFVERFEMVLYSSTHAHMLYSHRKTLLPMCGTVSNRSKLFYGNTLSFHS